MSRYFELNRNIQIEHSGRSIRIFRAVERFFRDMEMTLSVTKRLGGRIFINEDYSGDEIGSYRICFDSNHNMLISGSDELGIIYALLFISEKFLQVHPFWFWNDQQFEAKEYTTIPLKVIESPEYRVKYRGWFLNDEVLISHWMEGQDSQRPWEMAMEALLRCGGNMIIPGTDRNSKHYAKLADEMGLYITHHHAEPLGAEMFARVYPDLKPSYKEHKDLFIKLWKEGIEKQKDKNVIWNLGFRGQGDVAFWENDPQYDSDEKRGELISSIIQYQYELLCESVEKPICCTNLYGEIMELYQKGFIILPKDIIYIWADNGFGKMVSRRQGNHNPRVPALPSHEQKKQKNGLYYHVSFYDLQAANHITMLPNSTSFVSNELNDAYDFGVQEFWIINSSNIKPHVYYLNLISKLWKKQEKKNDEICLDYIKDYYTKDQELAEKILECFEQYAKVMLSYGSNEDEHCGEQFYNYTVRIFMYYWRQNLDTETAIELIWAKDDIFYNQLLWYEEICKQGLQGIEQLYEKCCALERECKKKDEHTKQLMQDSIFLHVKIHYACIKGSLEFCKGYHDYKNRFLTKAFYHVARACEEFQVAVNAMQLAEHDKWAGFYKNDCLSDIKQTVYLLRQMMGHIRNMGDGPHFYQWQREFLYKEEDKKVVLITNMENHLIDEELFQLMKNKF